MNYFIETALAPAKLFELAGDVKSFKAWLYKTHNKPYDEEVLTGHRFFLECAFTGIFHTVIYSDSLPFKNDPLLELAANNSISIDKMPGESDRRIILKHLFRNYLQLTSATTQTDLQNAIDSIRDKLTDPLIQFYHTNFRLKKTLTIEKSAFDKLLLIDSLLIHYTQINNSGPYAHEGALLHDYWIPQEKLAESFVGYKYTVQYLYSLVLPGDLFSKAELDKIHQADSWRKYTINKQEDGETDPLIRSLNETFDIEKQTCFESFFYRINDLLAGEAQKRYGISHMNPQVNLIPSKRKLPTSVFDKLLDLDVKKYDVELSAIEKRDYNLQWFPVDVSNILDANEFNGVAAFNTLVIGTLAVTEGDFVYVNKWKHPTANPDHYDYSYAVLLNTSKTSARALKGWMLFFDCCNDFTGSRRDFLAIEKILKDNKKKIRLSVEELGHEEFTAYLKNYVPDKERLINNEILSLGQITKIKENKELFTKYQKARGVLLELLCYYAVSNHSHYKDFTVKNWGKSLEGKDIDVLLESRTQIRLIECKYNGAGRNFNLEERIDELNEVVRKRKEASQVLDGSIEFWFWLPPAEKDMAILENKKIKYEIFDSQKSKSVYQNLVKLKKMREIFTLSFS